MAGQVHPSAPLAPNMQYSDKMAGATVGPLPPPATYSKPYSRRHRGCTGCCCCLLTTLCSILVAVVVILGITALVLWLVLRPIHAPTYSINDIQIKTFSVGSSNSTANNATTTLSADLLYNITATNPNKHIGIKYDKINIATSYDGEVFAQNTVPSFYSGHQNVTTIVSEFNVTNFALSSTAGSALVTAVQSNSVPLHTRADAKVRVKIGSYTSFAVWVHVDCDVSIKPPSGSTSASVISKSCKLTR